MKTHFEIEGEDFNGKPSYQCPLPPPQSCAGESELSQCDQEAILGCGEPRQRFLVSFEDSTLLGGDANTTTIDEDSKIKCKAFWEFVDSNPIFRNLIKEGRDIPPPPPQRPTCQINKKGPCADMDFRFGFPKNATKECIKREVRAAHTLPMSTKYRIEKQRRHYKARREAVRELQLKSGQPIFVAPPKQEPPQYFRNVYADEVKEVEEEGYPNCSICVEDCVC